MKTFASHAGGLRLHRKSLKRFENPLSGLERVIIGALRLVGKVPSVESLVAEHLMKGDRQPAIVASLSPLLVAAYSDELDCVALLRFPESLVADMNLEVGTRLLAVNKYHDGAAHADLEPGPEAHGRWTGFFPLIGDFLSRDSERLEALKSAISEARWHSTAYQAERYLKEYPGVYRNGNPLLTIFTQKEKFTAIVPAGFDDFPDAPEVLLPIDETCRQLALEFRSGSISGEDFVLFPEQRQTARLDFSLASLDEVDRYLGLLRAHAPPLLDEAWNRTLLRAGCYVGEVIRERAAEEFHWFPVLRWQALADAAVENPFEAGDLLADSTGRYLIPFEQVVVRIADDGYPPIRSYAETCLGIPGGSE